MKLSRETHRKMHFTQANVMLAYIQRAMARILWAKLIAMKTVVAAQFKAFTLTRKNYSNFKQATIGIHFLGTHIQSQVILHSWYLSRINLRLDRSKKATASILIEKLQISSIISAF